MAVDTISKDPLAALAEQQVWIPSGTEDAVQAAVQGAFRNNGEPGARLLSFLHGEFLHEPLHAVLTDIPIGAWTVTVAFDLLGAATGNRTCDKVADGALKLGMGGALLAACAGAADWSEIKDEAPRRIGSVHALLNIAATGLLAFHGRRAPAGAHAIAHGFLRSAGMRSRLFRPTSEATSSMSMAWVCVARRSLLSRAMRVRHKRGDEPHAQPQAGGELRQQTGRTC